MFKEVKEEKKEAKEVKLVSNTDLKDVISKLETLINILSKEKPEVNKPGTNDRAILLDISKTLSIFLESQLEINTAIKEFGNNVPATPDNKELTDAILEHNKLLKLDLKKSYKFDIRRNEDGIHTVIATPN